MEMSANLAATGESLACPLFGFAFPIIRGFIARRAVCVRGVAAPPANFRGSLEVTPHQQVKQHKVYDRPRKK